ncbi:MAG: hypothetical protein HDR88_10310 [Bacteroides sp.]|nr:hypothetical protein [Bacteroides sp.]
MFDERKPITTLAGVKAFASYLFFDLETVFHPDDDFAEYVRCSDCHASFSPIKAERLNQRMSECHHVCRSAGVDVCEQMDIAVDYFGMMAAGISPDEARKALYFDFNGTQ